jgi:hypothetical protein
MDMGERQHITSKYELSEHINDGTLLLVQTDELDTIWWV